MSNEAGKRDTTTKQLMETLQQGRGVRGKDILARQREEIYQQGKRQG